MPEETSSPAIEEYQARTRNENDGWRRALIVLLFLLFSFLCLLCSSQSALYFIDRETALGEMDSRQHADYGIGPAIVLQPLNEDELATAVARDSSELETTQTPVAVAVVIVPLPRETLVAQVPTVVPPIPTLTPTPTATPSPTFTPGSGSTPGATPTGQQTPVATPSSQPTAAVPTTAVPTTAVPVTSVPTTAVPTTAVPTTAVPTTAVPTTAVPTTAVPTTAVPTTAVPTTAVPTTAVPTTAVPTTAVPTTAVPTVTPTTTPTPSSTPTSTPTLTPTPTPTPTLTPTSTPTNRPPVAVDDLAVTNEEVATTTVVLLNDSDPDGDPITVTAVTQPPSGTVVRNPSNTLTYTPTLNFFGNAVFTYTISDGSLTDTARVTVTVNPINDPPVAVDDLVSTAEDSPENFLVLTNDSDVDLDPLSIILVGTPMSGTVSHDGTRVTYTPNPDVSGTDIFTYTISDGFLTDTATVNVTIIPINDPPITNNDSYSYSRSANGGVFTVSAPGVLSNDTDIDSTVLTLTLVTPPTVGILDLRLDGSFTYTYTGVITGTDSDTFTYQVQDESSTSNATVTIDIFP